ncbi:MAG: hypothetical protein IKS98_01085 [Lachnospiraceae bacterium]|nr:hypothetical protein [Lachnospiraceae bacterium]
MGKLSKEEVARYSGAEWMVRYVKEHGLEEAEKELERRGVRHIPLGVKEQDLKNFSEREKRNTIATVLMMSAMVLRDEFGFGRDRMNKFIDRFNKKTSCLVEGYVYWKDMQQTIAEETGIFIPLPDEFLDMGEDT